MKKGDCGNMNKKYISAVFCICVLLLFFIILKFDLIIIQKENVPNFMMHSLILIIIATIVALTVMFINHFVTGYSRWTNHRLESEKESFNIVFWAMFLIIDYTILLFLVFCFILTFSIIFNSKNLDLMIYFYPSLIVALLVRNPNYKNEEWHKRFINVTYDLAFIGIFLFILKIFGEIMIVSSPGIYDYLSVGFIDWYSASVVDLSTIITSTFFVNLLLSFSISYEKFFLVAIKEEMSLFEGRISSITKNIGNKTKVFRGLDKLQLFIIICSVIVFSYLFITIYLSDENILYKINFYSPIITLLITVIITSLVYKLNKSSNVKEYKMLFYNKRYYDIFDKQIRKLPPEKEMVKKNIEVMKYIEKRRNLCKSDGIWHKISEGVSCISNGFFLPDGIETYKEVSEETWDKINEFNIRITEELRIMKEKYEIEFFGRASFSRKINK